MTTPTFAERLARFLAGRPLVRRWILPAWARARAMRFPPVPPEVHAEWIPYSDYHRFMAIALALRRIREEAVPGALAEAGVFQGHASRFIHRLAPERTFYLLDTFEGFHPGDLEPDVTEDARFRATSLEAVLDYIGDRENIVARPGRVPETLVGLENEQFAFVLLDMDLYAPTRAALEFFYPRLPPGAYLMVHDYNNDESNWACRRAVDEFMRDKPEPVVEIADVWGSVMFRRSRPQED